MKEKTVFAVVVKSRHFLSDIFQGFRNTLGMNLKAYEKMIEEALEEVLHKLVTNYPDVYDIRFTTSQVSVGACEIIAYGKVK